MRAPDDAAGELALRPDPQFRRLRAGVDAELALRLYNVYHADCFDEEARLKRCCELLRARLERLNAAARDELDGHLRAAVDNCVAGMRCARLRGSAARRLSRGWQTRLTLGRVRFRYFRLQEDGPKIEEVSEKNPLVPR